MVSIGLQLWSVRQDMQQDLIGTLERVKQAGYDSVEFAGFGGFSAKDLKAEMDRIGLNPLSAHMPLSALEADIQQTVAFAAELGLKYVVVPYTPADTLADCLNTNRVLKAAAPVFKAAGIRVGYHNHNNEFVKHEGRYALDIIMDGVDGIYEIDTAWVQFADVDPVAYIASLGDRVGPIHAKELNADYKTRSPEDIDVAVGEGIINFKGVIDALCAAGTLERGIIVEQEAFTVPPYEALAAAVRELRRLLGQ